MCSHQIMKSFVRPAAGSGLYPVPSGWLLIVSVNGNDVFEKNKLGRRNLLLQITSMQRQV